VLFNSGIEKMQRKQLKNFMVLISEGEQSKYERILLKKLKDVEGLLLKDQTFPLLLEGECRWATVLEVDLGVEILAWGVELGLLGTLVVS